MTAQGSKADVDVALIARNAEASPSHPPSEFDNMLTMFRACVAESGQARAVSYFDGALTYSDIDTTSDTLASWLLAHGVTRGDRVSVILQNIPQFLMMLIATWKIGAIPVPGNPMYRHAELARIFRDFEPSAVLCLDSCAEEVQKALSLADLSASALLVTSPRSFQTRDDPRVLVATSTPLPNVETLEAVLDRSTGDRPPEIEIDGDEIGLILYTSGTTGAPKGAMIRHRSLAFNGQAMRELCDLHHDSRILAIAPFFHITGMVCHVATALSARATLILHYRVEPSLLLDIIREHRPTFTIGAITAYNALMNVPGIRPEDMTSFDRIYSGGAPIPPALIAELHARLDVRIHSAYGMTETAAHTHLAPYGAVIPIDPSSGALSIGKVTPLTSAKIVAEDGTELPAGEIGELVVRGPQIMAGYWGKPDETAAALKDGWMHTGDVAFFDADGWFYLVDRIKDVIIASGFKVWPREVEDVLYAHEAVREAAVVGVADSYRGETVKAYVSLKPGFTVEPDSLIAYCRQQLAAYKAPREVEIIDELPKTITGKIQRLVLREQAQPQ